jgi:hypothetical protein
MEALIRLFGNICRFKSGPQDIPASINLFIVLFTANLIIELFLGLSYYSFAKALILSVTSIITLFLFTWIWLLLFKFTSRFLQTAMAFVGISLFTNVFFFIPMTFLWQMGVLVDSSFTMVNLLLLAWILSIYAHIYKNALNVSFFLGIALSITYFISFSALSNYLIGVQ